MTLAANTDTSEIPVSWEDQEKINEFSCLTIEVKEISEQLAQLKEEVQQLQDAQEELLLSLDESNALIRIGEVFFHESDTSIQKITSRLIKEKETVIQDCFERKAMLEEKMHSLRANLYSKFGTKRINLDTD